MNENPNTQSPQPNPNTQSPQPNQAPQNGQTAQPFNPASSAYASVQVKPKKANMSVFDLVAWCINFVLTYFLIDAVINEGMAYGVTLVYFSFFAFATFYIVSKTKTFSKKAVLPGASALLCALSFSLHGESTLSSVAFFALIYLSGSYCVKLTGSNRHGDRSYFYLLDVLKCEVLLPLGNLFTPLLCLGTIKKGERKKTNRKTVLGVIIGILLAVPVLLVVIPLLQEGDAAFDNLIGGTVSAISNWFNKLGLFDNLDLDYFNPLAFVGACIFAPYIYSVMFAFRHGIADKENKDTTENYAKLRFAKSSLIGPFLGVISLVYVVYLFSQLSYLFSAFTGHLPGGMKITVAEYAVKGFGEMATIAVINFVLIGISVLFAKRKDGGKLTSLVKCLDLFLCVFTLVITASSISKILLYISTFGLTEKRVYVFAFDIVLVIAVICVIVRLFKEKFPYMKVILIGGFAIFTALNLVGTDTIINNYNVDMYLAGKIKCLDVRELIEIKPTSLKNLDKVVSKGNKHDSELAKNFIGEIVGIYYSEDRQHPYNSDEYNAIKYYQKNKDRFENYCAEYYVDHSTLFIYLDTKEEIETIEVYKNWNIYTTDVNSKSNNGTLLRASYSWENRDIKLTDEEEHYRNILSKENKEDSDLWAVVSVTTKDGKKHEKTLKICTEYKEDDMILLSDEANCISIKDGQNGLSVKAHFDTVGMSYNQILAKMQQS